MKKHRYIFIIATVLLLVSVYACTAGDVDAAPAATLDEPEQSAIPEKPPVEASNVPK